MALNFGSVPNNLFDTPKTIGEGLGGDKDQLIMNESGRDKCNIWLDINQTITSATSTVVNFDTTNFDTNKMHNNTEKSKITIKKEGYYLVICQIGFYNPQTAGEFWVYLKKNGTNGLCVAAKHTTGQQLWAYLSTQTLYYFQVGDYIEAQVYQNTGNNVNLYGQDDSKSFICVYQLI